MSSSNEHQYQHWSPSQVCDWLFTHQGLQHASVEQKEELKKNFLKNDISGFVLSQLNTKDLVELGVTSLGTRLSILKCFSELEQKGKEKKEVPLIKKARLEPEPYDPNDKRTEYEKSMLGVMYKPLINELTEDRERAKVICRKYNQTSNSSEDIAKGTREKLLKELFTEKNYGKNCFIEPPFHCDYGYNIKLGENVYMNYNCIILDCSEIKIGSNVYMACNVQILPASHPLNAERRARAEEYSLSVEIGNDVWIGGGVIILGGLKIGDGCVIGAGAVVTKDIPPNSLVVGNPGRVIAKIQQD